MQPSRYPIYHDEVTVRCNKCGDEIVFYPDTVKWVHCLKCGNSDVGSPNKDWPENKFGNFTLISRKQTCFSTDSPFGKLYF